MMKNLNNNFHSEYIQSRNEESQNNSIYEIPSLVRNENSKYLLILAMFFLLSACGRNFTHEQKVYIAKIERERKTKNEWMQNDSSSPFNRKGKIEFHDLNYFEVEPDFVFTSKLFQYSPKDTVTVMGTKGDERKMVRYGYFLINMTNKDYKVNLYEGTAKSGEKYYTISFTDQTTNKVTYGVGRYIEMELHSDPNHFYKVDFNLAFNPYCSYSPNYSCSIPLKEDYLPIAIRAGEKKFHD